VQAIRFNGRVEEALTHDVSARYERFALHEARRHSTVYEQWALAVAADRDTCDLIGRLPAPKRQPNLVFASVRVVGARLQDTASASETPRPRPDRSPLDVHFASPYGWFHEVLHEHWPEVRTWAMGHSTQTNEAGRIGVLLPAFAAISRTAGRPLALLEVGASAGLCLAADRWRVQYVDRTGASLRTLNPRERIGDLTVIVKGDLPLPSDLPHIAGRVGVDLMPLDPADPDAVAWLRALVWPGQVHRLARLDAALADAARRTDRVTVGDIRLPETLDRLIDAAPRDAVPVVFHAAVLAYLDADERGAFVEAMRQRVADRRCHWVSYEGQRLVPGADADLDPAGLRKGAFLVSLDGAPLMQADGHAAWILPVPSGRRRSSTQ